MIHACQHSTGQASQAKLVLAACFGGLLVACSTVQVRYPDGTTATQSREAFSAYVEQVFRYHNRVVDDLIVAGSLHGDEELFEDPQIVRAEERMSAVCQPLNDTVSATIEGREIGFFRKLQLPEAVPACEAASRTLEALLPAI